MKTQLYQLLAAVVSLATSATFAAAARAAPVDTGKLNIVFILTDNPQMHPRAS